MFKYLNLIVSCLISSTRFVYSYTIGLRPTLLATGLVHLVGLVGQALPFSPAYNFLRTVYDFHGHITQYMCTRTRNFLLV